MKIFFLLSFVCLAFGWKRNETLPFPLSYVNQIIGTGFGGYGIGQNNPAAQYPFGSIRIGPDTSRDLIYIQYNHFGGYYYHDTHIRALSHTHLVGAGLPDYGNFGVMPVRVARPTIDTVRNHGYRTAYSHESEVIAPGYYSVYLDTHTTLAELTATGTHAGVHRYIYDNDDPMTLMIDVCHTVRNEVRSKENENENEKGNEKAYDFFSGEDAFDIYNDEKVGKFVSPSKEWMAKDQRNCPLADVQIIDGPNEIIIKAHMLNSGSLTDRNGRGVDLYLHGSIKKTGGLTLQGFGTWSDNRVSPNNLIVTNETSGSLGAYLHFGNPTQGTRVVEMSVGLSWLNFANAELNLIGQGQNQTFDQSLDSTIDFWLKTMEPVGFVESSNEDDKFNWYTALFRTFMSPSTWNEFSGQYLGMDGQIYTIEAGHNIYTDLSLWDTFRSQNPWLALVRPDVATDIVRGLIDMYQKGGDFPRWPIANVYTACMFGDNCNLLVLDAWVKGLRDFDLSIAYPGLRQSAVGPRPREGRGHVNEYIQYGYVPLDVSNTGTCLTLSYAYTDYALAILASELGLQSDYELFLNRSQNYKHIFETNTEFMCPKYINGEFQCPENPAYPFHENYVEGNVWHYNFDVPHDLEGMVGLYPSKQAFIDKLTIDLYNGTLTNEFLFQTNFLPNPFYWQGNEHDLLFPWLFHSGDRPDLTQYWTRWLMDNRYKNAPTGLPGNDDYGTMSAWYTFGALSIYPLTGKDWYFVGSPVFDNAELRVPDQQGGTSTIRVIAYNNSKENVYVEQVLLNGEALPTPYITHKQLLSSPTLEFYMTAKQTNFFFPNA